MPKQILLVEDSITMQKVVEITFGHEDYQITSAREAGEALGRLRDIRPDIVIADAGLPGRTGYDLCAAIKAEAATREVPVLLLTGNFNPYDEVRGQKAGVDAHVIKPFETQVLLDKVADLLRRRQGAPAGGVPTVVSMPQMHVPQTVPAMAATEGRRPTVPPQAPRGPVGAPLMSSPGIPTPGPGIPGAPRPPAASADPTAQRSTLMGIPAVNPLGAAGMRPPPPPGMLVRQTGNLPAINPAAPGHGTQPPQPPHTPVNLGGPGQAVPGPQPSQPSQPVMSSWARPPSAAPQSTAAYAPSPVAQAQGMQMPGPVPVPVPAGDRPTVVGIPPTVPQMPRPSLIPRAPVPAPVLAVLERIAARGAEYEAIAKLSMEVIEQVVWEVVPELAEAMIKAEMDRLVKDRERQS